MCLVVTQKELWEEEMVGGGETHFKLTSGPQTLAVPLINWLCRYFCIHRTCFNRKSSIQDTEPVSHSDRRSCWQWACISATHLHCWHIVGLHAVSIWPTWVSFWLRGVEVEVDMIGKYFCLPVSFLCIIDVLCGSEVMVGSPLHISINPKCIGGWGIKWRGESIFTPHNSSSIVVLICTSCVATWECVINDANHLEMSLEQVAES